MIGAEMKDCGTCRHNHIPDFGYPCIKCANHPNAPVGIPLMWEAKEVKMTDTKKQIDWTKPIVSSAGYPVRILATDLKYNGKSNKIAYCITGRTGEDLIGTCEPDDTSLGFRNVPEKRSGYIAIGRGSGRTSLLTSFCCDTEEGARNNSENRFSNDIIATVKVEWEE